MKTSRPVLAVLALWLAAVLVLGAAGAFVGAPGQPPIAIGLGAMLPIAAFLVAYAALPAFRGYVLSADLRLLATFQAWRWAGIGFLSLYAYGVLPALFAFPAGLGDMAIGASAPFVVAALVRDREFAGTRRFVAWNLLGILDLVVALSLGALSAAGVLSRLTGSVTTAPMATMPLVLIPAFLVPLFLIMHLTALFQTRRAALA